MPNEKNFNIYKYATIALAILAIVLLYLYITVNPAANVPTNSSLTPKTTTTIPINNVTSPQGNSLNSQVVMKKILYYKKTVSLPAATYNPYYNYVIGCYWTSGAYNFSFNAPYAGYIVFNETNTGMPNNFSVGYFSTYISRQRPLYFRPQPYNNTSFCPGWDFLSQIDPWSLIYTYNNQTAIIPVKNGTNYVLFYNENANQEHGVNPFPINVTFSMTYYGFNGISIPNPPNTTTPVPNSIAWGTYP